ncbi:MAG: hypothetical protein ACYDAG_04180 [Chloroflexota bacterium]
MNDVSDDLNGTLNGTVRQTDRIDEVDISLADTLSDLVLLPARLAIMPLLAVVPPEARGHLRAAYRETRLATRALLPESLGRRREAARSSVIVD